MPNRIIRDWTTSEKIDTLSFAAEVSLTRLIMKADDHGCFHANLKLLKAAIFPLKEVSTGQLKIYLQELVTAGIVIIYEAEGREYLQITNFGQRLRTMNSKFPLPVSNLLPNVSNMPPETKRREEEVETEVEEEKKKNFIIIGESKIFEVLPILEFYEAQLNGTQKENGGLAWRGFVDSWFIQNIGQAFVDNNHVKNSFKKHYLYSKQVKTHIPRKVAFNIDEI